MKLTPDLAPVGGALPTVLSDLATGELLAVLDIDPGPLLDWIVAALGVSGWWKGVEFAQPVTDPAASLPNDTAVQRALPHVIPGAGIPPSLLASPNVEGLIGKLRLNRDEAAGAVSKLTGSLSKPGLLGVMSQPTVQLRVFDETGTQLPNGSGHFQSNAFVPELVFLPVAVASAAMQPTIRRSISIHVAMTFTPQGQAAIPVTRDFGPFPIDLATTEVPFVALLARHALTPGAAPGHVFVGVPQNSPLNSLGDVIGALGTIRTVLTNVTTVLGALGIAVPLAVSEALRTLAFVPTVAGDFRWGKGDLLGLWALFADWQFIMSAAMVFGPPSRRAFFGSLGPGWFNGFSLFPDTLGVGFIPDLAVPAIAAGTTVGTAVDNFPRSAGTYDNWLTSINFPPT
jgi:hypothetical protein